jgi:hypothetical protein
MNTDIETTANIDEETQRAHNDEAWKDILDLHLQDFVEFFWPKAYESIDWDKPYISLEQELRALNIYNASGKRALDKLFQVYLKNGSEQWLLLHADVQHQKDSDFEERMFVYYYRIFDKYRKDVASIAVLADKDSEWRPNQYRRAVWGSEVTRTFEVVKLLDYQDTEEELKKSNNPFALVVLAQLAAMKSRPNNRARLIKKIELFKFLLNQGWTEDKIQNMYLFLDAILMLSKELNIEYIDTAKEIEGGHNMHIVSSAEQYGFNRGINEGITQEASNILNSLLLEKFNEVPTTYMDKIRHANQTELEAWCRKFVRANSIDDVFKA